MDVAAVRRELKFAKWIVGEWQGSIARELIRVIFGDCRWTTAQSAVLSPVLTKLRCLSMYVPEHKQLIASAIYFVCI